MTDWARLLYPLLPVRWLENRLNGRSCAVLLDSPLVLLAYEWVLWSDNAALLPVFRRYRHTRTYLLVTFSWYHEDAWHIERITRWLARHRRDNPEQRVIFLANTETQREILSQAGLDAIYVNQNALVDQATYHPLAGAPKRFDAIYDARINEFKRHHLASQVEGLALLTSRPPHHYDETYTRAVHARLPGAHWYNDPLAPDYRSFDPAEINRCLNECRVGLCLSEEEGAMFASIQYLLAGLPVVSTASRGGRDVFFDPDYTCIVADDPRSVAEGVARMRQCRVPAEAIRARTIAKMETHLARLFGLLGDLRKAEGLAPDPRPALRELGAGREPAKATPADVFDRIGRCARLYGRG